MVWLFRLVFTAPTNVVRRLGMRPETVPKPQCLPGFEYPQHNRCTWQVL